MSVIYGNAIRAFLILNFTSCLCNETNLDSLKLTQIIFVHGEHTPLTSYPTDPYISYSSWPLGWGELTEEGQRQGYFLGQYLRSRYNGFLSSSYVSDEIYILSSDTDRTIMSAELCLAGMYPSDDGTSWNPKLNWQPIPIRSVPKEYDNLIDMTMGCPQYEYILQEFLTSSPPMKRINKENKVLFDYLTSTSGINVTDISTLHNLSTTLLIEDRMGLQIPEWAKLVVHTPELQYIYNLSFLVNTMTRELKRLHTGPLVNYLVQNMKNNLLESPIKTKTVILSGHQHTLVGLMNTLGILTPLQVPPYSTVFMLELHSTSGKYFIRILFRNDTSMMTPYQLKLPGCEFDCPLETFLHLTEYLIPKNWEKECVQSSPNIFSRLSSTLSYWITAGITFVINNLATVGMYLVYMYIKKKRNGNTDRSVYEPLTGETFGSREHTQRSHPDSISLH